MINLTLDDAARAKAGFNLGKSLTGTVAAQITTSLAQGDKTKAAVELDFTKAAHGRPRAGLHEAGRQARQGDLHRASSARAATSLDNIVFDGGGASVRGSAELDATGLRFRQAVAGAALAGDDLQVEATQVGRHPQARRARRQPRCPAVPALAAVPRAPGGARTRPTRRRTSTSSCTPMC